ncbi:preprotein translocase subunit SecE [Schlesneria paludicola]|uniref:preprotein translocase subunit SecE n=1 Tax=Schlesneria paludicola TaxID=360056 RepID=UPI00029AE607|nr:preprotein translocase subunit SecE [Schlesneria paludicola]
MAKAQRETLLKCMLSTELYQWKQGRVLRRTTAGAILLAFLLASQALYHSVLYDLGLTGAWFTFLPTSIQQWPIGYWLVGLMNLIGLWVAFRAVNYPVFADFLIDVESEMTKVTWPTWAELQRATVVVLGTMFIFSALLFGYDVAWQKFLELTGVLRLSS